MDRQRVSGTVVAFTVTLAMLKVAVPTSDVWAQFDTPKHFSAGMNLGYYDGTAGQASFTARHFAEGMPISARLGVGYAAVEPGEARAARKIFINNATNGIPEKFGRLWDYRVDVLVPVTLTEMRKVHLFGGVRLARFTGKFEFIGGNEDFDVVSKQWGVGGGLENSFRMGQNLDLVLTGGVDYYMKAELHGHDTWYTPDGGEINGREDYTFQDADAAIDQPELAFRVMVGVNRHF